MQGFKYNQVGAGGTRLPKEPGGSHMTSEGNPQEGWGGAPCSPSLPRGRKEATLSTAAATLPLEAQGRVRTRQETLLHSFLPTVRTLPSGDDCILCSQAMDGAIFYAKGNNPVTRSVFHKEVQGKIFHKVAGIIPQRLERGNKNHTSAFQKQRQKAVLGYTQTR